MSTDRIPYRYHFADGTEVVLPLSGSWYACLRALDREEENNDQAQRRRHCSLEEYNRYDNYLPDTQDVAALVEERDLWDWLCRDLTGRESQIGTLYFRCGYRQQELAQWLHLSQGRVAQIIGDIRAKFQKKWREG